MDRNVSSFFSGQREGVFMVLQALHNLESEKEFSKEYITDRLRELGLEEFIESIVEEYYYPEQE